MAPTLVLSVDLNVPLSSLYKAMLLSLRDGMEWIVIEWSENFDCLEV